MTHGMSFFSEISAEAEGAITEITDSANLVTTRQQIMAGARQVFRFEDRSAITKRIMIDFFATKTISTDTIYRGLFVQLGSVFELFVRKTVEAILEVYSQRADTYEQIPEIIRKRNFSYSGRALNTIHEGVSGRRINYDEISRKLGTCVQGNKNFELNKNCFTIFIGNCTSSQVSKLLTAVNVRGNFWTEVAKQKVLKSHFKGGAAKEIEKITKQKLDNYVNIRNGIVHRGELFKTIMENDIDEYSGFFFALTKSISDHLEKEI